jgi:hypothetical protein
MHSYTYLIKNRITNQFYYGSRCKNVKLKRSPEDDLWIYYFTSSKKIKSLITEFGKDSFDISFILKSDNFDDCYWMEQKLISSSIDNKLCLNSYYVDRETSKNKFSTSKISFGPLTDEHRAKISKSTIGKPKSTEHRRKVSAALKNKPKSIQTRIKMKEFHKID